MFVSKAKSGFYLSSALAFALTLTTYVGAAGMVPNLLTSTPTLNLSPKVSTTANLNVGSLSYAPTNLLGIGTRQTLNAGMNAAQGILNFQPNVTQPQVSYSLPVSKVDSNGFWNGVGQMPGAFVAPWQGKIPAGSGPVPFDYRISTPFYNESQGMLRQSTDGSKLPWEYSLYQDIDLNQSLSAIYMEQGFKNVNMGSGSDMQLIPMPNSESTLPSLPTAIGI